jgi:hypothetical protein
MNSDNGNPHKSYSGSNGGVQLMDY